VLVFESVSIPEGFGEELPDFKIDDFKVDDCRSYR
jgi:hypothetical protein